MEPSAEDYFRQSEDKIRRGDWDTGLTDLNHTVALDPNNVEYLWSRANLRYERDEYQKAVDDYTTIIALSSDMDELSNAHSKRAISYEHLGLYQELIADLDWLLNHGFETVNRYTWRGFTDGNWEICGVLFWISLRHFGLRRRAIEFCCSAAVPIISCSNLSVPLKT